MKILGKNVKLQSFDNLKLRTKIVLVVNTLLLFFLILFGIYFYHSQKNKLIETTDEYMFSNVRELENILTSINPDQLGTGQKVINSIDEAIAGLFLVKKQDSVDIMVSRIEVLDNLKNKVNKELQKNYFTQLKETFGNINYYASGYPFIIDKKGNVILHPTLEGSNVSDKTFFNKMVSQGQINGKINYIWPETNFGESKILYYTYHAPLEAYVAASFYESTIFSDLQQLKIKIIVAIVIITLLFSIAIWFFLNPLVNKINTVATSINTLANGKLIDNLDNQSKDEIGEIINSVNLLSGNLKKTAHFAKEIGSGKFNTEFEVKDEDVLGNALLDMQRNLLENKEEEDKRKEDERKQNWTSNGIAKFNDILRSNESLSILGDNLTTEIVHYLGANQCGLFVVNQDEKNIIELISAYAFNRKKFISKKIQVGEGIVGTCIKEGKTIYLKDVPENYVEITSGLGKATPRELLVVPLKHEDTILGVIEIASFHSFEKYQIEFVEQVAEAIASSVSNVMINENTNKLLEQARQQAEQLAAQEEEMRQTMEELSATQEEMQRKNKQMEELNEESKKKEESLMEQIDQVKQKEQLLREELSEKENKIKTLKKQINKS